MSYRLCKKHWPSQYHILLSLFFYFPQIRWCCNNWYVYRRNLKKYIDLNIEFLILSMMTVANQIFKSFWFVKSFWILYSSNQFKVIFLRSSSKFIQRLCRKVQEQAKSSLLSEESFWNGKIRVNCYGSALNKYLSTIELV